MGEASKKISNPSPEGVVDTERIEKAVREILLAVGEDPEREGLKATPQRVARMYAELLAGMKQDPAEHLKSIFHEKYDEIVLLREIPFYSICEHHLMPFIGKAHVAYLPAGRVLGVSKLARIVDTFARRLQVQERLTDQIADFLMKSLEPIGVAVVLEASHSCMTIRGIQKPGAVMVTSSLRGIFKRDPRSRAEVLTLMHSNRT
ncbi:MAG: GTP cyclohydrolase I FolE [Anaerohalosphaeraceae bacterium]